MYEISKVIDRIDWELLSKQKADLLTMRPEEDTLLGIIYFLDDLQDAAVQDGEVDEKTAFKYTMGRENELRGED